MPETPTESLPETAVPPEADAWGGWRAAWSELRAWARTDAARSWLLVVILLVGAYLRLSHLNWDQGTHIHPDERFLTMVESALQLPKSLGEFFDASKSPMNPYNKNFGFFVYGTLPIFIVRIVAEFAQKINAVLKLWTSAPGVPLFLTGYDGVHLVGRALSGLFDLAGVWLIYVIARRLYSRRVGLLAAGLLAFAVLPLQQSHFFTVDTFGTFFSLVTFYFAVRVAQGGERERHGGGWGSYLGLGASLGATIACRINLAPLAAIALLAAGIRLWDDWHRLAARAPGAGRSGDGEWLSTLIQATLFRLILMGVVALAVFRVAQPYAFGGSSLLDFSLSSRWQDNMRQVSQLIRGDADYPPGHQWTSRTPFVFPFVNMVVWGMGLPMGLTAWAGWALAAFQVLRAFTTVRSSEIAARMAAQARPHLLPVAWVGGMFLWQGLQYVQSMRYLLPIYPLLAMMSAWFLWRVVDWAQVAGGQVAGGQVAGGQVAGGQVAGGQVAGEQVAGEQVAGYRWKVGGFNLGLSTFNLQRLARLLRPTAYGLMVGVVVGTILWGWGFLAIYRRPLTRITASRWIYANVPPGKTVANEHWDDPLPFAIDGKLGFRPSGLYEGLKSSSDGLMQMYSEDTPEKRELLYRWLNEADYIVFSSNRLWGSIPRLPMRYPMTTLYYDLMFSGQLGFKPVLRVTSFPTIFGIQFDDSWAEEAFSVYDHPQVYVFEKTPQYSEALARSYFDPIDLENAIQMWPKQVSAAPTALYLTEEEAEIQRAGGTWSEIFDEESLVNRSPVGAVVVWLLALALLGVVAFPISFVVLRGLADRGYGVSRTLGLLLLAWLSWLGPSLKLASYQRGWILGMLALLIVASALLAWRTWPALWRFIRERRSLLLTQEVIFLVLFALFLLIRIGNPDLWHPARGGEKPMDLAYLNAVIRSTTFPPYDPWHAGGFLNYYYFGFVIVGTLIKLTGIVPWVAYNLAVPTLFALTGLGAFSVAYSLAEGESSRIMFGGPGEGKPSALSDVAPNPPVSDLPDTSLPTTNLPGPDLPDTPPPAYSLPAAPVLAGLAATLLVVIVGNLGNVKLLFEQWALRSTVKIQSTLPGLPDLMRMLDGALRWLTGKAPLNFPNDWWFWNASRVIPDTINEFPFFTFTYADLHAHMIALPLTLLGLACAVAVAKNGYWGLGIWEPGVEPENRRPIPNPQSLSSAPEPSPWHISVPELLPILLLGLVAGALRATNTWDFPTYVLVGLIAVGVAEAARRLRMPKPNDIDGWLAFLLRAAVATIWRTLILVVVASLAFYPYTRYYATAYAGLQGWQEPKTALPDYLVVWGFFLALAIIYLASEAAVQARERQVPRWLGALLPLIVGATIALAVAALALKIQVWLIALPLAVAAVVLACGREIPSERRLALLLMALALAITMGVEVVRQKDDIGRMNTVFKFYMQAWVLFGVSTAFGLASWAPRAATWSRGWRRLAWAVVLVLLVGVLIYPLTAARAKVRDRFSAEASPIGLDGMAYMDKAQYFDNNRDMRLADDKAAILWMLRNVEGSPVILEGITPNYRWGSRFSIYTGLPAVQGWDWHQKQQRSVVPAVVDRRIAQVREFYSTTDLARAQRLLDTYRVEYIIVGELERAYYNPAGLAKFDAMTQDGSLELAYAEGSVRIYRVIRRGAPADASPSRPTGIGPRPVPTPTPALAPAARESPLRPPETPGTFESPMK